MPNVCLSRVCICPNPIRFGQLFILDERVLNRHFP